MKRTLIYVKGYTQNGNLVIDYTTETWDRTLSEKMKEETIFAQGYAESNKVVKLVFEIDL